MSRNLEAAIQIWKDAEAVREQAARIRSIFCDERYRIGGITDDPIMGIHCKPHYAAETDFFFDTAIGKVAAQFRFKPIGGSGGTTGLNGAFDFFREAPPGFRDILLQYSFSFNSDGEISADPDIAAEVAVIQADIAKGRAFRRNVLGELVYRLVAKVEARFERLEK